MNEGRLEVRGHPAGHARRDDALRRRRPGRLPHAHRHRHRSPRRASRSSSSTAAGTSWCRRSSATSPSCAPTRGDTWGNLIYRGTSRNFNVPAAMCADYVIAEVENLYTHRRARPRRPSTPAASSSTPWCAPTSSTARSGRRSSMGMNAEDTVIAARAGQELKDGQIINLGIGLPDADRQLRARGRRRRHPDRERRHRRRPRAGARLRGPRPRQRRQPAHHAHPRRQLLRLRHLVRHDPRRPRRRDLPGHAAGRREGQHRQLDRARQDAGRHGRRHGPHHRRQGRLHRQRALLQGRRLQAHEASAPSR